MKQIELSRQCPVCSNNIGDLIDTLQYALYDNYPINRHVELVSCNNCGAVFYNTNSSEQNYDRYYNIYEYYNTTQSAGMGGDSDKDLNRFLSYIKIIKKFNNKKNGSVIDIGCAQGGLLKTLKNDNYTDLCGIDPLPLNVSTIQNDIGRGFVGNVSSIPLDDSSCDIIFLTHVLEHVLDLPKAMSEVHRVLREKGVVYIEIPNATDYPTNNSAHLYDFFYEHLNHFDKHALINLIHINDFSCLDIGFKSFDGDDISSNECIYAVIKKGNKQNIVSNYNLLEKLPILFKIPNHISNFITEILISKKPVYVWGLSSYMLLLLETYLIPNCNIIGIYDSDKSKQKLTINNMKIMPPDELFNLSSESVIVIPNGPFCETLSALISKSNYTGQLYVL